MRNLVDRLTGCEQGCERRDPRACVDDGAKAGLSALVDAPIAGEARRNETEGKQSIRCQERIQRQSQSQSQ